MILKITDKFERGHYKYTAPSLPTTVYKRVIDQALNYAELYFEPLIVFAPMNE